MNKYKKTKKSTINAWLIFFMAIKTFININQNRFLAFLTILAYFIFLIVEDNYKYYSFPLANHSYFSYFSFYI